LGKAIESYPQIASELKQQTFSGLRQFYVEPVVDMRFNYRFN